MVETNTIVRNTYTANGSTTTFNFGGSLPVKSYLTVTVNGVTKVLNTDYTIAGTAPFPSGVDVVFGTAPANTSKVVLVRESSITNPHDLDNLGNFNQEDIEAQFDTLTRGVQEAVDKADNAAAIAGDSLTATFQTLVTQAETARDAAQTAETGASTSATSASTSATSASTSATSASTSATLAQNWANQNEDVVVSGGEYSAKHYSIKSSDSAALAATTATNLAATLTGNYTQWAVPSVDGSNQFTLTGGVKAAMNTNFVAVIPSSGLTVSWEGWLRNNTGSSWLSQNCKIRSSTYDVVMPLQTVSAGTDVDISHDDGRPLYLYYNPNLNAVVVEKYLGV